MSDVLLRHDVLQSIRQGLREEQAERLGDLAIEEGVLTPSQLALAIEEQQKTGELLGRILVRMKLIGELVLEQLLTELKKRVSEAAYPPEVKAARLRAERVIDRYVLVEEIGHGAMGRVWKAWDADLQRWVAVKLLREESPRLRERFLREARIAAGLRHPHLVTIFDAGEHFGRPYLVMELVQGRPIKLDESSVETLAKIAMALQEAHAAGVVHRDLKPGNVLIDEQGEPKVVDFGLAHLIDASADLTGSGAVLGTPGYMAPEQVSGDAGRVGPAADVYALGVMLYESMTGFPPFSGNAGQVLEQILAKDPMPPKGPKDLVTICFKAMDKTPARRYPTAEEFSLDLRRFLAGEPIDARPPSMAYRIRRFLFQRSALAVIAVLCLFLTGGVTAALLPKWGALEEKRAEENSKKRALPHVSAGRDHLARLDRLLMTAQPKLEKIRHLAEQSLTSFHRALDEHPGHPEALLGLASVHGLLDDPGRALKFVRMVKGGDQRAVREATRLQMLVYFRARVDERGNLQPETEMEKSLREEIRKALAVRRKAGEEALFIDGMLHLFTEEFGDARSRLDEYAESRVSDPDAWLYAAFARRLSGDPVAATVALGEVLRYRPWYVSARLLRSGLHIQAGDYEKALADLDALLLRNPDETFALTNRGNVLRKLGKSELALKDADRAVQLEPGNPIFWNNRGSVHKSLGNLQHALRDTTEAIRLQPDYFNPFWLRMDIHRMMGNHRLALKDVDCALAIRPDFGDAYYSRGQIKVVLGDLKGAVEDYTTAIRLKPEDDRSYNNRGNLHLAESRIDKALADFSRALHLNPKNYRAYNNRAMIRIRQRRLRDALADLNEAIRIEPRYSNALFRRGAVHQALGNPTQAVRDLEEALKNADPDWSFRERAEELVRAIRR